MLGKYLNLLWPTFSSIWQIFIVANGLKLTNNLAIWSHWLWGLANNRKLPKSVLQCWSLISPRIWGREYAAWYTWVTFEVHCVVRKFPGALYWSSGYGRRLSFWWSWVRIPAPFTYLIGVFHINLFEKRPNINEWNLSSTISWVVFKIERKRLAFKNNLSFYWMGMLSDKQVTRFIYRAPWNTTPYKVSYSSLHRSALCSTLIMKMSCRRELCSGGKINWTKLCHRVDAGVTEFGLNC